jgi:hypothetical protein
MPQTGAMTNWKTCEQRPVELHRALFMTSSRRQIAANWLKSPINLRNHRKKAPWNEDYLASVIAGTA